MFKTIDRFGSFLKRWTISKKVLAGIFIAGFALSLIPIIITCFYSVPVFDDYNFGFYTHKSIIEGNGFFAGVISSVVNIYNEWQGFFTANLWASIQLFNIDVNLYFISNIVVLAFVIISFMYFGKVILRDVLNADLSSYFIITIPILFIYIQFMPSIAEGLYWMDGALSNMTCAIFLLIISLVIKVYLSNSVNKKLIYSIITIILTLSICGSGPMFYIIIMEIGIVSLIYTIKKKNPVYKLLIAIMAIYTIGIIIAAISPGNNVRLESIDGGMSLISAVSHALFYSVVYFGKWISLVYLSIMVFLVFLFYPIAKKSNYKFKNPLLVFVLLYLLYASSMSIQLYALGYLGAPRQMNMYCVFCLLCTTISIFYFVGWLSKRKVICNNKVLSNKKVPVVLVVLCAFTAVCGCLNFGVKKIASVSTSISFVKGETQQYSKEMRERIDLYENDKIKNVVVKPLSVYPSFFMEESLKTDDSYWTNRSVAKYYGKDSVVLATK